MNTSRGRADIAALTMLICTMSGCNGNQSDAILADLFEPFARPTPKEAALDLFDEYDADKRRRGVSLIAASPFGGEAEYVKVYRLMLGQTEDGSTIAPDEDPTVRAAAVKALGMHGGVDDARLIAPRLNDEAGSVRWAAAKASQRIHNRVAVNRLITVLVEDDDLDVRMAAAAALGQYAEPRVFDGLVGALSDRNFGVVESANRSLRMLTGHDFGISGSDWLAWADESRDELFLHRQPYGYKPYTPPPGFFDKLWFWHHPEPPKPIPPVGYEL